MRDILSYIYKKWESVKKSRKDSRLKLLYKGLKGKARIHTDDLIPKNRRCRNQHSLAFQIPSASKEAYKSSFVSPVNYSDSEQNSINSINDLLSRILLKYLSVTHVSH